MQILWSIFLWVSALPLDLVESKLAAATLSSQTHTYQTCFFRFLVLSVDVSGRKHSGGCCWATKLENWNRLLHLLWQSALVFFFFLLGILTACTMGVINVHLLQARFTMALTLLWSSIVCVFAGNVFILLLVMGSPLILSDQVQFGNNIGT